MLVFPDKYGLHFKKMFRYYPINYSSQVNVVNYS